MDAKELEMKLEKQMKETAAEFERLAAGPGLNMIIEIRQEPGDDEAMTIVSNTDNAVVQGYIASRAFVRTSVDLAKHTEELGGKFDMVQYLMKIMAETLTALDRDGRGSGDDGQE